MKIANFETHPAADLFPLMEGQELQALANDIKANGLHNPIVIFFNNAGPAQMLDGRNRARACLLAFGSIPTTTSDGRSSLIDWKDDCHGTGSPTAWVISQNLRRRHLDESQRAMVGARAKSLFEAEAKARQVEGARKKGRANLPEAPRPREQVAAIVNVSPRSVQDAVKVIEKGTPHLVAAVEQGRIPVSVAVKMADETPSVQESLVAKVASGGKPNHVVTELRRDQMLTEIAGGAGSLAPLDGMTPCPVIYADPPWEYGNTAGASAVAEEYPTMSLAEICALKVPATPDAVLFLWATSPLLPDAMAVITAWGFAYKASMIWDKNMGTGNWVLNCHELLLIAVRGKMPCPAPENRPKSVVHATRGRHSEKPDEFADVIRAMYPQFTEKQRFEMFARKPRDGFTVWGNQAA